MRVTLPTGTPAELVIPEDLSGGYQSAQPVLPAGKPDRGVVVVPDIGGLRPLFDEMLERLARERGWAMCAPEPFPGREHLDLAERMAVMKDRTDDAVLSDIGHAAELLSGRGADRIAVIGFCQGGMYALKAAGTGRFDRAVSFYGMIRVPDAWAGEGQRQPLDYLHSEAACPVLAILGGRDQWTPEADIEALRERPNVEIAYYPDAEHGFAHDPSRPSHRADDAADAWAKAIAFIEAA